MSDSLKQLIKQYPELGDVFADFETRLLFLENSLPNDPISEQIYQKSEQPEKPWFKQQWEIINQLRGMVQFLYSKETERRANASKRKAKRYEPF